METLYKVGTIFEITHCDGYVAHEVVAKVKTDDEETLYVCDSCAVYSHDELQNAPSFKLIINAI